MRILDRYVAKNFLIGYFIAFCVLTGLRIIIDLFVNLDEFTEHADIETAVVIKNIFTFYLLNSTLYFRDFAGMITVVAAAFSFGKMVRHNELVAVMASGVSLKRIIFPIVFLALLLTGVLVIDQELIIPPLADKLVRSHNDVPGQEWYRVRFISDGRGSLINSLKFDVGTSTLYDPTILLRRLIRPGIWEVTGRIDAEKAVYNAAAGRWDLYTRSSETGQWLSHGLLFEKGAGKGLQPVAFYRSDITARDIPVRCESEHKTLLSLKQLMALEAQ
jgi:lipopolysaccharide export system permease protein